MTRANEGLGIDVQPGSKTTDDAVIEIVSDVVCPWCFIGKRRLENALKLLQRPDAQLRWRAFELNPDLPKDGVDRQEYRIRKFGSLAYARQLEGQVAAAGAEEGITFRFDQIERIPNTLDAHRLIWLAGHDGVQDAVVERLFHAYFIDGQDVGKHEVLRQIGKESGLDSRSVAKLLDSDSGASEVLSEESHARTQGVNGVPTFFMNGVPITSGAHKPEVLASLISTALQQCSIEGGTCV
jgi:predicted DsbA family dithiol-disulfide isomerase